MINRKELVSRHNPIIKKVEALSPLSIGNGAFAYTADITGLQTFPEDYEVPLGTQSEWGWHYTHKPEHYNFDDITLQKIDTHGRDVSYPIHPEEKAEAYHWLRQNPHRLQLGQISFRFLKENNEEANISDIREVNQELNLWEGILQSDYNVENTPVSVTTICHPKSDQIGVKVSSPLIASGKLEVVIRFPTPDMTSSKWEKTANLNWENTERHQSVIKEQSKQSVIINRIMDEDHYNVACTWDTGVFRQTDTHEFTLYQEKKAETLSFSVGFAPGSIENHSFQDIYIASQKYWTEFWNSGGAIDFSGSSDPRANELERRVILSQFLIAAHSSGSQPPQETGLMYNSWFGKFHLEMHWWHASHFPLWGRGRKLAKSLDWYSTILPEAKELAKSQGYEGARWTNMVGFDGKQSPSPVATVLIWQQPHPIAMAELCYREDPCEDMLKRWKEVVIESANFMTSFAQWDKDKNAYVLGPPLIPAQECHKLEESLNPPFEVEYWKYGLEIAIEWIERLNEPVNPKWIEVASAMADLPHADGVYLAHENCPDTFKNYNRDHPSMLGAMGILPGSLVDPTMMRNTLKKVRDEWKWESTWGWDYPMCAMTAARLGEGEMAIDFLLMDVTKNTYLPNGHNYQSSRLTAYLPGNGGLLTAIAMMACGWHGGDDKDAPGFPQDGTWSIKSEGLHSIL